MNNDKFIADDAEKALIISMLCMKDDNGNSINFHETNYLLISKEIKEDDIRIEQIRIIYSRIKKLLSENRSIDFITIADNNNSLLEYLVNITDTHFMYRYKSSIAEYIKIVKEKAALRKIYTNLAVLKRYIDGQSEIEDIESLKFKCQEAFNIDIKLKTERGINEIMDDFITDLKDKSEQKEIVKKKLYGLNILDELTGGTDKGELTVLAARPSIGKTALAIQILKHKAFEGGNCVIFNLEMSDTSIAMRLTSQVAKVDSKKLKDGNLDEDDWIAVNEFKNEVTSLDVTIVDDLFTVETIINKCRELNIKKQLDYIVIDYLQLIDTSEHKFLNANGRIEYISRQLKMLNKTLKCPILLLSQLTRAPDSRDTKRPTLSDLRSSGAIEQDADNVLFLWREENEISQVPAQIKDIKLFIAKQRNGVRDVEIDLKYNGGYFEFEEDKNSEENKKQNNIINFNKNNRKVNKAPKQEDKEQEQTQMLFSEVPF